MYILLTDPFSRKTFDIANILKRKNYKLLVACSGGFFKSILVKALYTSKTVQLSENNFTDDINVIENNYKCVFFPIEEKTILKFYEYLKYNLNSNIKSLLPTQQIFNLVRDKGIFSNFCLSNGINVPKEYTFNEIYNMKILPSSLIIKPKIGAGSVGIKFIDDISNINILDTLDSSKYLIQERIKNGQNILGGFFLANDGDLVSYYGHKRIRTYPEEGGVTVYSKVDINEEIKALGSGLLKKLNWSGIAMIEFLYDENSKTYKIIELNPRAWGSIMLSEFCNSNIIENYINLSIENEITDTTLNDKVFIRWLFPWDVISYIKKKGNIEGFWNLNTKNTCYINNTYSNFFQAFLFLLINIFDINKLRKLYLKVFKK